MNIPDDTKQSFPIVCIGASAGGLDALQRFLDGLPKEFGFALVFVQHLSSKHKSLLAELLSAKRPSLAIQEISEGLKALPGRLYLCPPGREVRVRGGFFRLTVHPEGLIHLPIDEFLASLAEDAAERAIAVIFSGAGTDGARGSRAIRDAGGTVFVQDPATAEFSSMPLSVIATGQADAVLSPEDICREILKLQDTGAAAAIRDFVIAPEEYDAFFRILLDKTGGRFNHYKKSVVGRRIRRRMYLQGVSSVKEYLDLVSSRDAEAASLASDLMIGVTSFFRDRVAWKAVNLEVVRKLIAEDIASPVRVWTPASATGEEAYSIAMMLAHELSLAGKKRDLQIFATDVNNAALEKAREGTYPASISADVPAEYIQKYFTSSGDGRTLAVNKEIRESVVFAKQDLLTDPPFSRLDLIICRNFLIYLEPDAQEKSISLFHYSLKDNGFLFLGNAETVGRRSTLFKTIGHKQCRLYRKIESRSAARLQVSVPYATERAASQSVRPLTPADGRPATGLAQEFLLEEYAPAAIAIDQNYDIVYHSGPTNQYLRQPRGIPTQNALDLLPEGLKNRIRGAVYRAGQEGRSVSIRANLSGDDNRKRPVTLRISKIKENLFIIVFQGKGGAAAMAETVPLDGRRIDETALHQLESELSTTRQDLKSHIEQLKSVNEELQSSNEELQASNEEMETSREELQSLNEELVTVNSQLQMKIEEQDETNNDLNNFLASTNIPTIFLDQQFRVKRYTPAMSRLLKLIPSDLGRPIIDMSQEGIGPDLIADARAVLDSLVPIRKELVINGTWYIRAALPYRTADNRIEGVIITYSDVTDLKNAEELTRHLASFPQLNPNPVLEVDASGKVIFFNPATQKVLESLGMDKDDVHVFIPADIDSIRNDMAKQEAVVHYREIPLKERVFATTLHHVPQFDAVRIYAYENTERKRAEEALKKSEELFRLAVDNMPDALGIYDAERRYVFVNAAGLKRIGKPLKALVGRRIDEMYGEEARSTFWPALMRTYETGTPQTVETSLKMGTGQYDIIIRFVPMMKDGRVHRVLNLTFDITDRKRAEEALKESEMRYHSLFENMSEGFALCKMLFDDHDRPVDFIYLDVNGAFGKITGLENIVGKKVTEVIPGIKESHPELFDIYGRVALTGQRERFEIEFKPLRMWLHISVYSMEQGYFVAVFDDITERKRSEAEILKLSEDMAARNLELESLNKELEAFNYSISHDLRAPLRSMAGFSKVMMEDYAGKLDDQGKDYLARIRNSSEKMTRLIDDLLRLSKISRQEIDRMDIDLSKLAESVVHNLRESSAGKNVEVVIREGIRASADPNLMRVVMTNLLDNAWKFTGKTENARVEFGSLEKDGKTVYFVKDNGAGFGQQYAYKMFWPFHRLHGDREFAGTGIGLAIVDRIIRRHGGKVWAEGEVGKGAEVFFTLG